MLFVISSIYDPPGLACSFLLQGRRLFQGLFQVMHGWAEMVPDKNGMDRSIRPEVFCEKCVLRNFTKFIGKHLWQSLFQ